MKTNELMWGLFMTSSMKAAILLVPKYTENLMVYKNTNFKEIQNLFGVTEEIQNVKAISSTLTQKQMKGGTAKQQTFNYPILTQNCW